MTKDNVTGKNKDFYDLGKKIFDRLNPQGAINLEMPKARTGDCLLTKVCAAEGHAIQKQREWVGLTDEDIQDIEKWIEFKEAGGIDPVPLGKVVLYISDQLRKKNNG
jgi:hypothetical protein